MISLFFLTACGGGGGTITDTNDTNDTNIIATCPATTTLRKGDEVKALEDNTEVKVFHKVNGIKTVCVQKGKAKISKN